MLRQTKRNPVPGTTGAVYQLRCDACPVEVFLFRGLFSESEALEIAVEMGWRTESHTETASSRAGNYSVYRQTHYCPVCAKARRLN